MLEKPKNWPGLLGILPTKADPSLRISLQRCGTFIPNTDLKFILSCFAGTEDAGAHVANDEGNQCEGVNGSAAELLPNDHAGMEGGVEEAEGQEGTMKGEGEAFVAQPQLRRRAAAARVVDDLEDC
jgi:hypothetical protein